MASRLEECIRPISVIRVAPRRPVLLRGHGALGLGPKSGGLRDLPMGSQGLGACPAGVGVDHRGRFREPSRSVVWHRRTSSRCPLGEPGPRNRSVRRNGPAPLPGSPPFRRAQSGGVDGAPGRQGLPQGGKEVLTPGPESPGRASGTAAAARCSHIATSVARAGCFR